MGSARYINAQMKLVKELVRQVTGTEQVSKQSKGSCTSNALLKYQLKMMRGYQKTKMPKSSCRLSACIEPHASERCH